MINLKHLVLVLSAAVIFTACEAPAGNAPANSANAANSNANAAKPVAAAPTKDALVTLEKSAYEAWKTKDAKFWDGFLTANFVGFGATGKLDKAAAMKEYAGTECDVKSYALSEEQMTPLGADAAMITYRTTIDGTCGGQKIPANSWAAGIYVREGDKWKGAFHAETPVVDPNAAPVKPAAAAAKKDEASSAPAQANAATDAMMALEKKAWEDWKDKNSKGLEDWASKSLMTFSGTDGRTDRAASIKRWMEDKCEVKSISLTDPASVSFGSDFGLLTFKSSVNGKCGGTDVPDEFGATVYTKEDGVWKALFSMGSPAA
ncbi:hypothetical protein BH20ACI2_BH20ACI2_23810 [soil metagenome]